MTSIEQAIKNATAMTRRTGKADYLNFLRGKKLTRAQAIKATCFECVGGEDTSPCKIETCPLTPFSQWNGQGE